MIKTFLNCGSRGKVKSISKKRRAVIKNSYLPLSSSTYLLKDTINPNAPPKDPEFEALDFESELNTPPHQPKFDPSKPYSRDYEKERLSALKDSQEEEKKEMEKLETLRSAFRDLSKEYKEKHQIYEKDVKKFYQEVTHHRTQLDKLSQELNNRYQRGERTPSPEAQLADPIQTRFHQRKLEEARYMEQDVTASELSSLGGKMRSVLNEMGDVSSKISRISEERASLESASGDSEAATDRQSIEEFMSMDPPAFNTKEEEPRPPRTPWQIFKDLITYKWDIADWKKARTEDHAEAEHFFKWLFSEKHTLQVTGAKGLRGYETVDPVAFFEENSDFKPLFLRAVRTLSGCPRGNLTKSQFQLAEEIVKDTDKLQPGQLTFASGKITDAIQTMRALQLFASELKKLGFDPKSATKEDVKDNEHAKDLLETYKDGKEHLQKLLVEVLPVPVFGRIMRTLITPGKFSELEEIVEKLRFLEWFHSTPPDALAEEHEIKLERMFHWLGLLPAHWLSFMTLFDISPGENDLVFTLATPYEEHLFVEPPFIKQYLDDPYLEPSMWEDQSQVEHEEHKWEDNDYLEQQNEEFQFEGPAHYSTPNPLSEMIKEAK